MYCCDITKNIFCSLLDGNQTHAIVISRQHYLHCVQRSRPHLFNLEIHSTFLLVFFYGRVNVCVDEFYFNYIGAKLNVEIEVLAVDRVNNKLLNTFNTLLFQVLKIYMSNRDCTTLVIFCFC